MSLGCSMHRQGLPDCILFSSQAHVAAISLQSLSSPTTLSPGCRFHYTMLAWLPTFFTETLSMDITHAAQISLLPPMAALAASCIAGPTADSLIEAGWSVAHVRKAAQLVAFLGPASCLLAAMAIDDGYITVGRPGACSFCTLLAQMLGRTTSVFVIEELLSMRWTA